MTKCNYGDQGETLDKIKRLRKELSFCIDDLYELLDNVGALADYFEDDNTKKGVDEIKKMVEDDLRVLEDEVLSRYQWYLEERVEIYP